MTTQTIRIDPSCPTCHQEVCLEWDYTGGPSRVHCKTQHEDYRRLYKLTEVCAFERVLSEIDPTAEHFTVVWSVHDDLA